MDLELPLAVTQLGGGLGRQILCDQKAGDQGSA